jgi:hypothetical protein
MSASRPYTPASLARAKRDLSEQSAQCEVLSEPPYEPCHRKATVLVTFSDGQTANACQQCALHLQQLASEHRTAIGVRRA